MRAAFATRGFARRYAGLTASMLGDSLMLIVLSMWVKSLTGSKRGGRPHLPVADRPGAAGPAVRLRRGPDPSPAVAKHRPEAGQLHWRQEVVAGARHIRRTPLLLHPTIISGLNAGRVIRRLGEPRALVAGLVVLAAGLGGVAASVTIPQLFVATAVLGAGIPLLIVAYNTLLQKQTPGHLMGRVSTSTEVLTTTPQALSIATGALLVTFLDWRLILLAMVVGTLAAAGYLLVALRGRFAVRPVSA